MKKIIVVAIFLFTLAVSAFAQYDSESDFDVRNDPNNPNGLMITKYLGSKTTVNIPPKIENLPVISIGREAFTHCDKITSITMPNGITRIGDSAFSYCTSLTSITIPNGITSIGNSAFWYCNSLVSITIPDGVEGIFRSTFEHCTNLTNVTIPNSVTKIYEAAFKNCSSLTSIIIPNSVTDIMSEAFDGTSLTSVTFQGTILSIRYSNGQANDRDLLDLRTLFYATDKSKGTPGTYTRPSSTSRIWTKQ